MSLLSQLAMKLCLLFLRFGDFDGANKSFLLEINVQQSHRCEETKYIF